VRKIAARFGVDPSTVQRISRPFNGASLGESRVAAQCDESAGGRLRHREQVGDGVQTAVAAPVHLFQAR